MKPNLLLPLLLGAALVTACTASVQSQGKEVKPADGAAAAALSKPLPYPDTLAEVPDSCPVTRPPESPFVPPEPWPSRPPGAGQFWFGDSALWTALPTNGSWAQLALGEKFWWWSEAFDVSEEYAPDLTVAARRLDGDAPAFQESRATNGYHESFNWAMLMGVELSSPGCWSFTGHYKGRQLSFVLWVPAPSLAQKKAAPAGPTPYPTPYPDNLRQVPDSCPVTRPQEPRFAPPEPYPRFASPGHFWYGSQDLWTSLPIDYTWSRLPRSDHDGGYVQKVFWWRTDYDWQLEPRPALTVTGRRLDGDAPPMAASQATNGFHPGLQSFMLVGVSVPTTGCWEISGRYDDQGSERTLSFVIWVAP
jgi:hypothetical protein